jgi:outer membrane protein, multidrug efflux system
MSSRRSAALLSTLLMAGCALGKDYRRPDVLVPEATRGQVTPVEAASLADLGWWDIFGDARLEDLVTEAVAANHDLRAAAARVEQARQLVGIARAEMLPLVGYDVEAGRQRAITPGLGAGTGDEGATFNSFLSTVNLAWEIDVWGRIRRQTEAAKARLYAAEDVRRGVLLTLTSDVASAYFELVALDLQLAVTRASVATFRETSTLFENRFEGGIGTMLEVSRARAAQGGAESQVPEIERLIVLKENQISVLLGRLPGRIERTADLREPAMAAAIPVGLPSDLLERRPDLLAAEHAIVAANAEVGAALASFFPRLGLTSFYGGQSTDLENLVKHGNAIWGAGASISGPIFQGGRLLAGYRGRSAQLDEAIERYRQATLSAFSEVSSLLVSHEKTRLARDVRADSVEQLRMSVSLSLQRYRDGISSYFEVLDAQQQYFPSQIELVRLQRDQLVAVVGLYRALGGGWAPADLPRSGLSPDHVQPKTRAECRGAHDVEASNANPTRGASMAKCENCGNDYYRSFEVKWESEVHVFDSFECAIHSLAPCCDHCGTPIIGHGMEAGSRMFCCAHCSRMAGDVELRDHA